MISYLYTFFRCFAYFSGRFSSFSSHICVHFKPDLKLYLLYFLFENKKRFKIRFICLKEYNIIIKESTNENINKEKVFFFFSIRQFSV